MSVKLELKEPFVTQRMQAMGWADTSKPMMDIRSTWQALLEKKVLEKSGFEVPPDINEPYYNHKKPHDPDLSTPEACLKFCYLLSGGRLVESRDAQSVDYKDQMQAVINKDIALIEEQAKGLIQQRDIQQRRGRSGSL